MELAKLNDYQTIVQSSPHPRMSSKYGFIPTLRPIEVLKEAGWYPTKVVETKSKKYSGYQKHMVRFRNDNLNTPEGYPEIVLTNSHQGSTSFQIMLGFWRIVCSNGLIVGNTLDSYKVMHIGYTDEKVNTAIQLLSGNIDVVLSKVETYRERKMGYIEQQDYVNKVVEVSKINLAKDSNLLATRRTEDGDSTKNLWQTLNVVQENVTNGNYLIVDRNNVSRKAVRMRNIDRIINFNRSLWEIADNFM